MTGAAGTEAAGGPPGGAAEADLPLHFRRVGDGIVAIRPRVRVDTGSLDFFDQVATANLATGAIVPWGDRVLADGERAEIERFMAETRRRDAAVARQSLHRLMEEMERVRRLVWDGAFEDEPALLDALVVASLDLRDSVVRRPNRPAQG